MPADAPSPHLSGPVSTCLAAFANNTANEDLMATTRIRPGVNFCRARPPHRSRRPDARNAAIPGPYSTHSAHKSAY